MRKKRFGLLIIIIGMLFILSSCIMSSKIEFDLGYDNKILKSETVIRGRRVDEPNEPIREGYKFVEWQLDGKKFDFTTKVTRSFTLIAVWKLDGDRVLVEFDSDGGALIDSQEVIVGSKVVIPDAPTKKGYLFLGWYLDEEKFDFNTFIEVETVLVAKWEAKIYSLLLPSYVKADQDNLNNFLYGDEVILTITLEEELVLEKLLINGNNVIDEIKDGKYPLVIKENVIVEGVLNFKALEASFSSKEKVTTAIADSNVNSYLSIMNLGSSSLDVFYQANNSTSKAIFNNDVNEVRLYPGSKNGGSLIIKIEEGYIIDKIEVETGNQNAGFSINGEGEHVYLNKVEEIILSNNSNEVEIKNVANATTQNRVDIKNIKIYYKKVMEVLDIIPPEITLNVGVKLSYKIGEIWDKEEALLWVSVFDNVDGDDLAIVLNDDDLYNGLVINGVLKFDLEGTYQIVYVTIDSAGNIGVLRISINVLSSSLETLEEIDYSGFNNYYLSLNNSSNVINDMAFLLRDTVAYKTYGEARYVFVPYEGTSGSQVVLYDYEGRDKTYKLITPTWGSGGIFKLSNGASVKIEREHVWPASDMLIRPKNNSKSNTSYVGYNLNLDKSFEYRPDNNNRGHYADFHNLWHAIGSANGTHSNYFYGEEKGPSASYYLQNQIFYPGEEYVGDIARILFYMTLMYPYLTLVEKGDKNAGVLNNIYYGYLDVLMYWNEIDPPSSYEIYRNELIFTEQKNRNPFIDFYDDGFAEILFSFGDPNVLDN